MPQAELGLDLTTRRTREWEFLAQMDRVVPWADLAALCEQHAPTRKTGHPPFEAHTMLRIHFKQPIRLSRQRVLFRHAERPL
jgi:IS5 family transposase